MAISPELQDRYRQFGFEYIRSFEDGRVELRLLRYKTERRVRCFFYLCAACGLPQPDLSGAPDPARLCGPCRSASIAAYKEKVERQKEEWHHSPERKRLIMENGMATRRKREAHLTCAKARWRNQKKIAAIYERAKRKSAKGKPHDVDHIYPIISFFGCGLHVHENLRVLPASENRSKNNGFPVEHSPALRAAMEDGTLDSWVREMRAEMRRQKVLAAQNLAA